MAKPHKKKLTPTYNGIVAAYEYEGVTPGMMWFDSSVGTRPNGIASGAPFPNWTGLPVSLTPPPSAVPPVFDGVDDACGTGQTYNPTRNTGLEYIYQERLAGHVPEMEIPTTGTVELWFKPAANSGSRTVLAYHYLLRVGTTGTTHMLYIQGVGVLTGPAMSVGTWYHSLLTFTYGGTCDWWINGTKVLAAQAFLATHTIQRAWDLGNHESASWPFAGQIDTARFYNRVLTDAEIARNYQSGLRFHQ